MKYVGVIAAGESFEDGVFAIFGPYESKEESDREMLRLTDYWKQKGTTSIYHNWESIPFRSGGKCDGNHAGLACADPNCWHEWMTEQ